MPLTVGVVIRDPVGPRQLLNVCGSEKRCPIFEKFSTTFFVSLSHLELPNVPMARVGASGLDPT